MSLRGVRQLKELVIRYSDYDGSSRGVREWIHKDLVPLATNNPQTLFTTIIKRAKHPFLRAVYMNGNTKTIDIKNKSPQEITTYAMFLRNQIGRKMSSTGYKYATLSTKPSIQGQWHERLDLISLTMNVETKAL